MKRSSSVVMRRPARKTSDSRKRPARKEDDEATQEMPDDLELPVENDGTEIETEKIEKKESHVVGGKVAHEYSLNGWRLVECVTPKGRHYMKYNHPDGQQKFYSKRQAEKAGFKEE